METGTFAEVPPDTPFMQQSATLIIWYDSRAILQTVDDQQHVSAHQRRRWCSAGVAFSVVLKWRDPVQRQREVLCCCGEDAPMPSFRKLSPAEIAALDQPRIGARAEIARAYDESLADFAYGDYGRAELVDGERRTTVRRRLQAAARRRGLALRFRSGPGPLTFRVTAAPVLSLTPPREIVAATSLTAPTADSRRPRPPRRRQTATERYHDVLPRWMRAGQQGGRRNGTAKRRPR
jgi:hypothetical protein